MTASPLDVQFQRLRSILPGWLDGDGLPPHPQRLEEFLRLLQTLQGPTPHCYPTLEGEVTAEWSTPNFEISVTTSEEGPQIFLFHKKEGWISEAPFKREELELLLS